MMNGFSNLIEKFISNEIIIPKISELEQDPLLEEGEIHLSLNESFSILRFNKKNNLDNLRLRWLINILKDCLALKPIKNLNCQLIINIADGTGKHKFSKFCFSQKNNSNNILIPDPHNIETISKAKKIKDIDIDFKKKYKKAIFRGSSTGQPIDDRQLSLREYAASKNANSEFVDIKISPVNGELDKIRIIEKLSRFNLNSNIFSDFMSIEEQLKYQIILNIDGHTTSWERPLWIMSSNSICLNIRPYNIFQSWYSLLIDSYCAIPQVDLNLLNDFIKNNNFEDDFWKNLKENQKIIAQNILCYDNQLSYLNNVISFYNEQFNIANK